jgi:hypothetical protein
MPDQFLDVWPTAQPVVDGALAAVEGSALK